MKTILAEQLLVKVMQWESDDVTRELPKLQAMAEYKYDEYQQFSPGMRFVESLATWLSQFNSKADRDTAYSFIRNRLIFMSAVEMAHLVNISFQDVIQPFMFDCAAEEIGAKKWAVKQILNSEQYAIRFRRTLFLGLSDGARIDVFRRSNPEISNEQIWLTYDLSDRKAEEMRAKLARRLQGDHGFSADQADKGFQTIVLLDDFSASGISYFRKEVDGSFDGKIFKILNSIKTPGSAMNKLVDPEDVQVAVVLYLSTTYALENLRRVIGEWAAENGQEISYRLLPVQVFNDSVKINFKDDAAFIELARRHFDNSILTESYLKGKHDLPHLGFDECALPLVLTHNSPNNSIPLVWFEENRQYRGIFPRVSRH